MTDRPIIFSGPMICALLEGRKTMTRRLAWGLHRPSKAEMEDAAAKGFVGIVRRPAPTIWQRVKPGDRLWVRETWKPHSIYGSTLPRNVPENSRIFYCADGGSFPSNTPWRSPIHMLRWASRLTLVVTATKIERLQSIGASDAMAEGVCEVGEVCRPVGAFAVLWNELHGSESWAANPEVVVLTFTVNKQNIDALPKLEAA